MRADIREDTIRVAEVELRENGCYIILAAKAVIDAMRDDWSVPVQLMASSEGGIAELTIRETSNQESKP